MSRTDTLQHTENTEDIESRYRQAESFMQGLRTQSLVQNDNITPRWIGQTEYFWYPRHYQLDSAAGAIGKEYRLVDAVRQKHRQAFDHDALAQALGESAGCDIDATDLPIQNLTLSPHNLTVRFSAFGQYWHYEGDCRTCTAEGPVIPRMSSDQVLSPNGKQVAFTRDNNLWVRSVSNGEERALTNDGEALFCYGAPQSAGGVNGFEINVGWSPDSKKLFTVQRDTRRVKTLPLVNYIPDADQRRPTVELIKLAMQGDEHREQYRLLTITVSTGEHIEAQYPQMDVGADDFGFFAFSRRAWWANDSQRAYFIDYQGDYKVLRLVELETSTGATRVLLEESADTYVNFYPEYPVSPLHRYLPETDELIWWSERSGWGHLYLYDLNSGQQKHAITQVTPSADDSGWQVRNILHLDTVKRELLIQTAGRSSSKNPYYRDICRVHIDTGELVTLVSTDHDYGVHMRTHNAYEMLGIADADGNIGGVAPSTNYLVATRSRVDQIPVSLLLNRQGETLMEIETADVSTLPEGWQWPESVKITAADNTTDIYSVIFRPSNFSEDKRYPVINMVVGGPWLCGVPHGSFHNGRGYVDRYYFQGAALAELGFIVVIIDSRGTPLRGKAFQDTSYGWIPSGANSEDHRVAIEQLASRYPSMDLNRVGIYSPTGYQGGLHNLFECPDFYSVGVICGHMDARLSSCTSEHSDKYQGLDVAAKGRAYPEDLAKDWDGKLLFFLPISMPAYPAAGTLRVVDALQKANRDVDLLVSPDGWLMDSYEQVRVWNYLVKHLQGSEPPKAFTLGEFQW